MGLLMEERTGKNEKQEKSGESGQKTLGRSGN
jgi:hypothetical protein